jgi:radical SAM superfamily enzyme YgiQ (UPF0313 family)
MSALERSTCWSLSIPFETGSERTAKLMSLGRKWMTREEGARLVGDINSKGIESVGFFIIGYPGETEDDVKITLDYANSLPLKRRFIYFATPYPGTKMYEKVKKEDWLIHGNGSYKTPVISTDVLSVERLTELWRADREAALERIHDAR